MDRLIQRIMRENAHSPRGGVDFKPFNADISTYISSENRNTLFDKCPDLRHLVCKDYRHKIPDYLLEFSEVLRRLVYQELGLETEGFLHPLLGYALKHEQRVILLPLLSEEMLILRQGRSLNYYSLIPTDLSLSKFRRLAGGIRTYNLAMIGTIDISIPINTALTRIFHIKSEGQVELPFYAIIPEGWAVYDSMDYTYTTTKAGIRIFHPRKDKVWIFDNRVKSDYTIILPNGKNGDIHISDGVVVINKASTILSNMFQEEF